MIQGMRWVSIKLFLFTVVTVIVTLWLASIIGNFRFFSSPYALRAQFSDATGLLRGDVVKVAGVTIGRVDDIRIEHGLAVVTMSIDEGVELPQGMKAEIRFRNLVGQRMISMQEPRVGGAEILAAGDLIPLEDTDPAFDLTVLFDGLRPLIRSTDPADINLVTKAVVDALGGRGAQV
ncbi:MAG: MlaD family protein, partial [Actinomycetota bacterium]